ncbi:MAG TPA: hypothetical protein VGS12_16040 [Caulobacteraceae bacterium]|nr:hypothetical protein [Caulobacteraceae bacterium]
MAQFIDVLIQLLTFGVVALASYAALQSLETRFDVRRRLASGDAAAELAPTPLVRGEGIRNPFLRWVQASTSISDTAQRSRLRRDLALAGFDHPTAPAWYVTIRFAAAIGLPLVLIFGQLFLAKPLSGFPLIFFALLLCGVGLLVPRVFVQNFARVRREQLEHEFPDALDLMVICVEAGLGLEAAFIRVGEETAASHPGSRTNSTAPPTNCAPARRAPKRCATWPSAAMWRRSGPSSPC